MNPLFRSIATAWVFVCLPFVGMACDICGCAAGSNSLGLLPLVPRHFIGFRFSSQGFHTDAHGSEPDSKERFQTLEVWGRWQPHRRLQVIGAVPFQVNHRQFDNGNQLTIRHLGDFSLLTHFSLLKPEKQAVRLWQHTAQLGMGLKIPTGRTDFKDTDSETEELLPAALQPGSGTTDFMVSGLYALRRGNWGTSLDASLRLMGNRNGSYQFGHRLNAGGRVFFTKKKGNTVFLPYLGAQFDGRQKDLDEGYRLSETGGWATLATVGVELFRKNIGLSLSFQMPLASDLSKGHVSPAPRLGASAVLLFGGAKTPEKLDVPLLFPDVQQVPSSVSSKGN